MSLNLKHTLEVQKRILSLDPEKKKFISNAVIKSHFSSCLVIWTFSLGKFNKLINGIHEKSLTTVYADMMIQESTFQEDVQPALHNEFSIKDFFIFCAVLVKMPVHRGATEVRKILDIYPPIMEIYNLSKI